ncbi:3D-(3,5/4)-trihydroxycyclohexane-1,2-dione acylhydrolase (decyclizing) [Ruania halotolerans]|uniref:3D-(3,5/4)-trihydroxycyclohexane-1,2-dione acylhydrolase (decyclizing) n=1 Tax=Ruania halotolerans TaxID=2897773 RepID=UPI001E5703C9|nr:3D-(3,5/4)-trihydroxycyclohexane-1,2-dione acylhydrolase (decyclizing) [Ruania halotolerans]UFU06557.1 3D-(3,5/4)-trihydroxycyclohexane-1,2-dione acylhydrolase (decyclizing) [Ruania halotolerans]
MTAPVGESAPNSEQNDTVRLTVAQALVRFLSVQYTERDGIRQRLIPGAFGIFGHGNVAGVGQALLQNALDPDDGEEPLPYYLVRNEQAMVHSAVGFARSRNRLQTFACTASIGPGSTNMVTGAALATINRVPVLLLPSDIFATRRPDPVLQQLEDPRSPDVSVNDAFRPVSRFWDRIIRPEQLIASLPQAMRVLTDPAETGAVTLCLPQDVQAEAFDFPLALFRERTWHVARPVPEPAALERAAQVIRTAKRPLLVAGGGAIYSGASEALEAFADATGIPVADTQAGKGALPADHPCAVGGVGSTGAAAANALAAQADVVIGVGTRYSDFTTASHTAFADPDVRFVNLNVAGFDAAKHSAEMLVADAREGLTALAGSLHGYRVDERYSAEARTRAEDWARVTAELTGAGSSGAGRSSEASADVGGAAASASGENSGHAPLPAQVRVFGALNELMGAEDVVINAAGSMPGDLQALWRAAGPAQYHLEYGYSCMGYEIPAAIGVRLARPEPEHQVVAIVGDGTYQMMPTELATIVAERLKVIVVVLQNHGFASIGALSESVGSQRFGTEYRMRDSGSGRLEGDHVGVDLAANAASFGVRTISVDTIEQFRSAYAEAAAADDATVIVIETDPRGPNPPATNGWDVPVAEVSRLESTQQAYAAYAELRARQRHYL